MFDNTVAGYWLGRTLAVTLHILFAASLVAQPPEKTFKVLLAPIDQSGLQSLNEVDIQASVGAQRYTIRNIQPLQPGAGQSVIVVDFGATTPPNQPCLLAEVQGAIERLHENPPPVLIAAGTAAGLTSSVALGSGRQFEISGAGDLRTVTRACGSGKHGNFSWGAIFGPGNSSYVFYALANSYDSRKAPVRVFWLSETFHWFRHHEPIVCDGGPGSFPCHEIGVNFASESIEQISESDMTVFPIVFADRRKGVSRSPSRFQTNAADYMARNLGGFATVVNGPPGDTLLRVFEATSRGVLLSIEGPVSSESSRPGKLKMLTITNSRQSPSTIWQRPFVVTREGMVKRDSDLFLTPLVLPSDNLALDFGCRMTGASQEPSLSLTLPRKVYSTPRGQVDVYVEYLNGKGIAKQRTMLSRSLDPSESLCVSLPHAHNGTKFRVVIFDHSSGWRP
jgi:hypothetical protein